MARNKPKYVPTQAQINACCKKLRAEKERQMREHSVAQAKKNQMLHSGVPVLVQDQACGGGVRILRKIGTHSG